MSKRNETLLLAYKKGYYVDFNGNLFNPSENNLKGWITNKGNAGCKFGYYLFSIGKGLNFAIARLQAYQKFGDKMFEPGIEVRHINNNSLDNSWDNIQIGTHQQNMLDNPKEDRLKYALNAAKKKRKLTPDRLAELRTDRRDGFSYRELAEKYNIVKSTVSFIVNGKTYIHP